MSIKHDYGRLLTFIVLLIVSSSTAIAQELMKVTGLVVDQNAEPLIGVTVKVKGDAKSGTVTGLDGDFSIMVQKGKPWFSLISVIRLKRWQPSPLS